MLGVVRTSPGEPAGDFSGITGAGCQTQSALKIKLQIFTNYIKNKGNRCSELLPSCLQNHMSLSALFSGSLLVVSLRGTHHPLLLQAFLTVKSLHVEA